MGRADACGEAGVSSVQYFLKDQLLTVFHGWGVTEPLPKKGRSVVVAFPGPAVLNTATVTLHENRSTHGKPLYKVEFSNN